MSLDQQWVARLEADAPRGGGERWLWLTRSISPPELRPSLVTVQETAL